MSKGQGSPKTELQTRLRSALAADDVKAQCLCHLELGSLNGRKGDFVEAANHQKEACRLAEQLDEGLLAIASENFGVSLVRMGRFPEGIVRLRTAERIFRTSEDRRSLCYLLNKLAVAHINAGETNEAQACLLEAFALAKAEGEARAARDVLGNLGLLSLRRGRPEAAQAFLRESIAYIEQGEGGAFVFDMYKRLALALAEAGDSNSAIDTLKQCLVDFAPQGTSVERGTAKWLLAQLLQATEQSADAAAQATSAIKELSDLGHPFVGRMKEVVAGWK
ncbi:MAG: tetratricopeptide repeat protein [Pirellulaceae bacterium]